VLVLFADNGGWYWEKSFLRGGIFQQKSGSVFDFIVGHYMKYLLSIIYSMT